MPGTTTRKGSAAKVGVIGKAAAAKVAKQGSTPANLYTLAALVAQLPAQGTQYGSAAALFAAAAPGGYPRTLGTQARGCLRQQGQGVGRGKRHGVTPAAWLAAYNASRPNQQVHA